MESQSVIKVSSNIILLFFKATTNKKEKNKTLDPSQVIEALSPLPNPKRDQSLKLRSKQMEEI